MAVIMIFCGEACTCKSGPIEYADGVYRCPFYEPEDRRKLSLEERLRAYKLLKRTGDPAPKE